MKHHILIFLLMGFIIGCDDDESTLADDNITINFAETESSFSEGSQDQTIAVTLSQAAAENVTIQVAISGTAELGSDYELDPAPVSDIVSLTIAQGQTSSTITINPLVDAAFEEDETIVLTLLDNDTDDNLVLGINTVHTATLENIIVLGIPDTESSFSEGAGEQTVIVNLASGVAPNDVTIQVAISGTATLTDDYTLDPEPVSGIISVTVTQGQTTSPITISPIDDSTLEGNETIVLTLIDDDPNDNLTLTVNTVHTATLLDNETVN